MARKKMGVVYSTNPAFEYVYEDEPQEEATLLPAQQQLRVRVESHHRGDKRVTVVSGFVGTKDDLEALGKRLRTRVGTGGSVVDGEILVQGEQREKVLQLLLADGYRAK